MVCGGGLGVWCVVGVCFDGGRGVWRVDVGRCSGT